MASKRSRRGSGARKGTARKAAKSAGKKSGSARKSTSGKKSGSSARKSTATKAAAAAARAAAARPRESEWQLEDERIESALQTGEHAGLLEDYFGREEYEELRQLARDAAARSTRGGPPVLILPGIMGSKLGRERSGWFDDVVWIDPVDVIAGHLGELALPAKTASTRAIRPLGVILFAYLKLKLRLRAAGYAAEFLPFDWRQSIDGLGRELAARIAHEDPDGHGRVSLVAHSMGGLVARSALGSGAKVRRLIMLGTPNFGSFAPVAALRATNSAVRKAGWLDFSHNAEELASDIFSTFAGLTQMLPAPEKWAELDLYDLATWPKDGLRPQGKLLDAVAAMRAGLADGGENVYMIAGVDQDTVTGMRARSDGKEFEYEMTRNGDGTVPLDFALLPGAARTYYVAEKHGSLANSRVVARAVADLLARGETNALPTAWSPSRAAPYIVSESDLRLEPPFSVSRGTAVPRSELRHVLDEFAAPDARDQAVPLVAAPAGVAATAGLTPGYAHRFDRVVVGRRRQHRIDLRFALGSITEADTRAIALGIFRDVAPAGAASAIDERLDGAITELTRRRMFGGEVGEIFMLPTGRHTLGADTIAFVGLGAFDRFNDEALQTAAENLVRTFVRARVEEFSTVLFGGGSGEHPANGLRNLLTGFLRGLRDADADHHFRRIVVCEYNAERYTQLKEELFRLSSTTLCDDVEITFDEIVLPPPLVPAETRTVRPAPREQPVYLIVRRERGGEKEFVVRSSLLTAGGKATIVSGSSEVSNTAFEKARNEIVDDETEDVSEAGGRMAQLILADEVLHVLPRFSQNHLVVVHDAFMSRVPWETLSLQDGAKSIMPAATAGVSHLYAADNLSVAKWLEERIEDDVLTMLLVVDPTRDLQGAREEGRAIQRLFAGRTGVTIDLVYQGEATRPALLEAFGSGRYDVVHYAGHAEFDEAQRERSGIVCADDTILSGADLATISRLPTLMFFNACESARLRGRRDARAAGSSSARIESNVERSARVDRAVGMAESFLRGGLANFIGTYWPVNDAAADAFARTFYGAILQGATMNAAVQKGRAAVRAADSRDWTNYLFYGNPDFVVKLPSAVRGEVTEIDVHAGSDSAQPSEP